MDVILGMLLLDEQMKLKMHSTGSCLQTRITGIPTNGKVQPHAKHARCLAVSYRGNQKVIDGRATY